MLHSLRSTVLFTCRINLLVKLKLLTLDVDYVINSTTSACIAMPNKVCKFPQCRQHIHAFYSWFHLPPSKFKHGSDSFIAIGNVFVFIRKISNMLLVFYLFMDDFR